MKVVCKQNTARDFNLKEVTTIFSNEYEYPLEINKEYMVMGMAIYKDTNCLYYLIDTNGFSFWFPYLLFDIIDNSLPNNWFVEVYDKTNEGDILFLSGFDELCNDEDYHDSLMDRDEKAMRIYFKRKIEFEGVSSDD